MKTSRYAVLWSLVFLCASCERSAQIDEDAGPLFNLLETPVGTVSFPVDCNAEAAPLVERGVALLHHMMYEEAGFVFGMADDVDPECTMAYWGQVMAMIHPLWPGSPDAAAFERASKIHALAGEGRDVREKAYLATTRAYFDDAQQLSESERLRRFHQAWSEVAERYPNDLEARAFHSLALRATADHRDKAFTTQREAGKIAESVLEKNPDHPGAHHYIIHAYDFPGLAEKALETANHYGEITPRVPHATHMMTHIYTRLGEWDKAITWNRISADTAWELCVQNGEINLHYTHALDYLAYAHLQKGDDDAARAVLADADALQPPYSPVNRDASAYAFAALPARFALERRDWEAAFALEPRSPASFPWDPRHDAYVAITHFARALAAARLGRPGDASADIDELAALKSAVYEQSPYWSQQIEIQEVAARAWQAFEAGHAEEGLRLMQQAADLESATEKHAVTPGEVLPAAELYGDMLRLSGRYEEALEAYRTALARSPRRFLSLYGAAKSAAGAGEQALAAGYFEDLIALAGTTGDSRMEVTEAERFLAEI